MTPFLPFTEHRILSVKGGTRIYARDYAGHGPALVMMHGFPNNLGIYDALIPRLVTAGRRVVVFDFLGFGASDKLADATYEFAQQRGDLERVVAYLDLGAVELVAHDSSGIVSVDFALAHRNAVSRLHMLNSAVDASPLAAWPEMIVLFGDPTWSALARYFSISPAQFGWLLEWQQGQFAAALSPEHRTRFNATIGLLIATNFTTQPSAAPAFVQMAAHFYAELARNIGRLDEVAMLDMPVTVIWGIGDPYPTRANGEERARRFRHGTFHPVDASHWLQSDEPALVAKEILS